MKANILLSLSFVLFLIGIFAPVLTFKKFFIFSNKVSIITGVFQLLSEGYPILFILIFGFSIFLPLFKLLFLFGLVNDLFNLKDRQNKILHWTPRILAILYTAFISMFAFDSTGWGLVIHLIPTYILVALILISWKRDLFGAISFGIFAIATVLFFNTYREIIGFLIISLPLFVISVLFYLNKKKN